MKETQKRARVALEIQQILINSFTAKSHKRFMQKMAEVAILNRDLVKNNSTAQFCYKGKWYTDQWWNEPSSVELRYGNRELHHTLIPRVEEILNERSFCDIQVQNNIKGLISNAIQESPTLGCLRKLVTEDLWCIHGDNLPLYEAFELPGTQPLTDDEVIQFHLKNSRGLTAINQFKVKELLLK